MLKNQKRNPVLKKSLLNYSHNSIDLSIRHKKKLPVLLKKSKRKRKSKESQLKEILSKTASYHIKKTKKLEKCHRELLASFRRKKSLKINTSDMRYNHSRKNSTIHNEFDLVRKNSSSSARSKSYSYYNDENFCLENSFLSEKRDESIYGLTMPNFQENTGDIRTFRNNIYFQTPKKNTIRNFLRRKFLQTSQQDKSNRKDTYGSLMKLVNDEISLENYYRHRVIKDELAEEISVCQSQDFASLEELDDMNFDVEKNQLINIISLNDCDTKKLSFEKNLDAKKKDISNYVSSRNISYDGAGKIGFDRRRVTLDVVGDLDRSREESHELYIRGKI